MGSVVAAADNLNQINLISVNMSGISNIGLLQGHRGMISTLVFTSEARRQLISVGQDSSLKIWDLKSRQTLKSPSITSVAVALDINYTESKFATGHKNGDVKIWSLADCKEISKASHLHSG